MANKRPEHPILSEVAYVKEEGTAVQGLEGSEGGLVVGTLAMRQSGPEAYCVTRSTCSLCLKRSISTGWKLA